MVDADTGGDEAAQILADRRVEPEPGECLFDLCLLGLRQRVEREVVLRRLGRVLLREVHEVDRRLARLEQFGDAVVQRGRAVLEVERNGSLDRFHDRGVAPGPLGEVATEELDVAERRRHQQELCVRELEQRHLPRPAPLGVAVEVELVDDGDVDGRLAAVAQRPVGEDLLRAADDRGVRVDGSVAGDHPHAIGSELAAQREELLAHERLDRGRVHAALAVGQGSEVRCGGHERLTRTRRRVEDHVVAEDDLEDRLLLRRVELEAELGGVVGEPGEDGITVDRAVGQPGSGAGEVTDQRGRRSGGHVRSRVRLGGAARPIRSRRRRRHASRRSPPG